MNTNLLNYFFKVKKINEILVKDKKNNIKKHYYQNLII